MTSAPTVTSLEWLSEEAREASLTLEDGVFSVVAFSHPCGLRRNDRLTQPLFVFESSDVIRVDASASPSFTRANDPWGYTVIATLVSHRERVAAVGGFRLKLGLPLPGDLKDGDQIRFTCLRLDASE